MPRESCRSVVVAPVLYTAVSITRTGPSNLLSMAMPRLLAFLHPFGRAESCMARKESLESTERPNDAAGCAARVCRALGSARVFVRSSTRAPRGSVCAVEMLACVLGMRVEERR